MQLFFNVKNLNMKKDSKAKGTAAVITGKNSGTMPKKKVVATVIKKKGK